LNLAQLQRLTIALHQYTNQTITLTPEQQHYLTRVLRLRDGDRFIAICAQEPWQLAELKNAQTQAQCLEPLSIQTELEQPITLCAALPKGQGFDEVVRAVTELGITTLVPILSARTVANPSNHKVERWRRIATEAAEQSCRQIVPEIYEPLPFEQLWSLVQSDRFAPQQRFICVTDDTAPNLLDALTTLPQMGILIMVGPEGGWTPAEQAGSIAQDFSPVSLGRRILRAITASIAVVSVLATRIDAAP
jgi:16S rRNA (uracil1498-N3)-methyltransferase